MADKEIRIRAKKPSFFSSVMSGIGGAVKGLLAGGVVGTLIGGAIGAAVAYFAGPEAFTGVLEAFGIKMAEGTTAAVIGAAGGAALGGSALAGVGAISGTLTGVVKSREAGLTAERALGLAEVTHAQGVSQGVALGQQIGHAQAMEEAGTLHRDRILRERAQRAQQPQHIVH